MLDTIFLIMSILVHINMIINRNEMHLQVKYSGVSVFESSEPQIVSKQIGVSCTFGQLISNNL